MHGELRPNWPWVKEGIENIRRRNKAAWLAEDLYAEIRAGMATLYINEEANSFAIVRPTRDPYTGAHGAELLAVYLEEERGPLEEEFFTYLSNAGAEFLQMDSKRIGFSKIGWDIEKIIYRRRI